MHWLTLILVVYVFMVITVCLRILYDTDATAKAFAYLLITVLIPVVGMLIYFAVGANYRRNKLYNKKIVRNKTLLAEVRQRILIESEKSLETGEPAVIAHKKIARLLLNEYSPLTGNNDVKLLLNGENKFPEVIKALKAARHHIHMEYYIFENDTIGNQIKDILIKKASEGVKVRFIYDDFGSSSIRKTLVPQLLAGGVEALPFYKILFIALSNRANYRNHRKIIVVDGCTGFVGGINVTDRYINSPVNKKQVFWRDTHVRINGPGVYYLQYLFIADWNFCTGKTLKLEDRFFCHTKSVHGHAIVQIAASGPDSDTPTIMFSQMEAITTAKEELLITSPYFIPGESVLNAIMMSALSGVKVKLLVPDKSDSRIVNAAARSYYGSVLDCGVEIYLYKKGFVHAKTLVADSQLAIIGSANMDHRSFELNFEVNSMIYDTKIAQQLRDAFYRDIKNAIKITPSTWKKRSLYQQLPEKMARLLSPLL